MLRMLACLAILSDIKSKRKFIQLINEHDRNAHTLYNVHVKMNTNI